VPPLLCTQDLIESKSSRYNLTEEIGRGKSAVVRLAKRDDAREFAVKCFSPPDEGATGEEVAYREGMIRCYFRHSRHSSHEPSHSFTSIVPSASCLVPNSNPIRASVTASVTACLLPPIRRELTMLKKLTKHLAFVTVEESCVFNGQHYLVMERMEWNLATVPADRASRGRPSPIEVAATTILKQLLCGVDFLHSKNIVHRDLKVGPEIRTCIQLYIGRPTLFAVVLTPMPRTAHHTHIARERTRERSYPQSTWLQRSHVDSAPRGPGVCSGAAEG